MARKTVQIQVVRKTRAVVTDPATKRRKAQGAEKENKYIVTLKLAEGLVNYFNIPTAEGSPSAKIAFSERSGGKRFHFSGVDDLTGKEIDFSSSNVPNSVDQVRVKTARFLTSLVYGPTGRQKYRSASVPFPRSFSNLMILQALGTMLKRNQPDFVRIGASKYPFVALTGDGASDLLTGAKEGAWVITSGGQVTDDPNDNISREDPSTVVQQTSLNLAT